MARRGESLTLDHWLADLTASLKKDLELITKTWAVVESEAHDRLRRFKVIAVSEEYLADTVATILGGLVEGDSEAATELLAGYLADKLHREIRDQNYGSTWIHMVIQR